MAASYNRTVVSAAVFLAIGSLIGAKAHAAGVLYADPGWFHAFEGSSAYYHDPDGPNPDYVSGMNNNQPGGKGDDPALIDVGVACEPNCEDIAIWQNDGSQWDGSAPGDPLGGTGEPFYNRPPPIPPAAPGGVGAYSEGGTDFVRIQDTGLPNPYGWADKDQQACETCARQEGSNRRIQFKHELNRDPEFSEDPAIMDSGITISFRARVATATETAPLDDIFNEDGPAPMPWPVDGIGYPIGNNGRGMFMITHNGAGGPEQLAFSLLNQNFITAEALPVTKTGLVMNNRATGPAGGPPDTGDATEATLNIVEIDNAEVTDWHEFWITVQALATPTEGNTHEVNVYRDGSLEPETFQVVLGQENEFGTGSFLGLGLSSGSRFGAFDVDFYAYKEGVVAPTLAPMGLAGDYNDDGRVDAADYTVWQDNFGGLTALPNETVSPGMVTTEDFDEWKSNFGNALGSGAGLSAGAVPEPASMVLTVTAGLIALAALRRDSKSSVPCCVG